MGALLSGRVSSVADRQVQRARKVARLLPVAGYRRALRHGVAAGIEHHELLARLRPASVIDIGANVGQFALAAVTASPGCEVHSFEPLGDAANRYRMVLAPYPNATLHEVAIGPISSVLPLHVSNHADSSSLLPISDAQAAAFPGTHEVGVVDVAVEPLTRFVDPARLPGPTMLKIDVQGGEALALAGADSALDVVRWVYIELSFVELYAGQPLAGEIVRVLDERGLALAEVNTVTKVRGRPVQADVLFERRGPLA